MGAWFSHLRFLISVLPPSGIFLFMYRNQWNHRELWVVLELWRRVYFLTQIYRASIIVTYFEVNHRDFNFWPLSNSGTRACVYFIFSLTSSNPLYRRMPYKLSATLKSHTSDVGSLSDQSWSYHWLIIGSRSMLTYKRAHTLCLSWFHRDFVAKIAERFPIHGWSRSSRRISIYQLCCVHPSNSRCS